MMQKLWLKKPKLNYNSDVFDIVQFGSSVIEGKESRDIDLAVIFKSFNLKDRLVEAQKIKKQIENYIDKPIDVSSYDLNSLFDNSNFAREGILFYGKSILNGLSFAEKIGLNPKIHLYYILEKLEKKDKVRFNYMLSGKNGEYGLLRKYSGRILKPGVIEIDPEYELIFTESFKKFDVSFKVVEVLTSNRN